MSESPTHDEIVDALRLYGGTTHALADALDLSPDNREFLRRQRLKETADDKHARARADSQLMKAMGVPENVRVAVLQKIHYGGLAMQFTARVVIGDIGKRILDKADAHEKWIRASPTRLAKHLKTLPKLPQKDLR